MLIGESNIPRLADLFSKTIQQSYLRTAIVEMISTGHASILQQVSNNTKLAWTPARYYNSLGAWPVLGGFGQQRQQVLGKSAISRSTLLGGEYNLFYVKDHILVKQ